MQTFICIYILILQTCNIQYIDSIRNMVEQYFKSNQHNKQQASSTYQTDGRAGHSCCWHWWYSAVGCQLWTPHMSHWTLWGGRSPREDWRHSGRPLGHPHTAPGTSHVPHLHSVVGLQIFMSRAITKLSITCGTIPSKCFCVFIIKWLLNNYLYALKYYLNYSTKSNRSSQMTTLLTRRCLFCEWLKILMVVYLPPFPNKQYLTFFYLQKS